MKADKYLADELATWWDYPEDLDSATVEPDPASSSGLVMVTLSYVVYMSDRDFRAAKIRARTRELNEEAGL